jgi:RNA polymerase sigma factor (sigma-70 family)
MTGAILIPGLIPTRSFDARIRPLMPKLLAYFVRRVTPSEDAADCLSETLVVLWRRRSELPVDDDGVRAWSYGIAKGVLANHHRSRVRHTRLAARLRADLATTPIVASIDLDLDAALATLADTDRELVLLVAWDGFGVAEAGVFFGLSPAAARTRYSRARKSLRSHLATPAEG